MKPWHSSSLAWFSLLTACLFGYVATVDNTVAQLCAKWKNDTNQNFLAMGIITEAGGVSRFYAVSTEFEGTTVSADQLFIPPQGGGGASPTINLTDAEALDLSRSKDSWPVGEPSPANGKGAFILAFKPEAGFHSGEKFLAYITGQSSELFLVSLTNPETQVERVPFQDPHLPLSRTVISADNKLTPSDDTSILTTVRFVKDGEADIYECNLRREEGHLRIEGLSIEHLNQLKPSLDIDGAFLLNGNQDADARIFALSNAQRKMYLFYGKEETPVEVSFADFLICPEEVPDSVPNALKAAGIAVPVLVGIGAVFFFMSGKKQKNNSGGGAPSAVSGTVSVSTGAFATSVYSVGSTTGKSAFNRASGKPGRMARSPAARSLGKFKTCTPVKPNKKPRTANQKRSASPGALARSMVSSPGAKARVFKFKGAK